MRLARYRKGEPIIITEGEVNGEMYVLLEGEILINRKLTLYCASGADKKEKSHVKLSDSDNVFFGEMSMFGDDERSATVNAPTNVSLGVLTSKIVRLLAEQVPYLGYMVYYNIGQRLANNLRSSSRDTLKSTTAFCLALEGTHH